MNDIILSLYQPDIPQNAGNLFRTAACFGVLVHVIEPCGFALGDARMRRAGMDYLESLDLTPHASWQDFRAEGPKGRLVLLTTQGSVSLSDFRFQAGDILLLGRESAGVPDDVHAQAGARVRLPMRPALRSLNVAVTGAIALYEALRQLGRLPDGAPSGEDAGGTN